MLRIPLKKFVILVCATCPQFARADDVYILTRPLEFSSSEFLVNAKLYSVSNNPTLLKKVSEKNGIVEIKFIQINGVPNQKTVYVSSKWFSRGTQFESMIPFQVDPNKVVKDFEKTNSLKHCQALENKVPEKGKILDSVKTNIAQSNSCDILKETRGNYSGDQKKEMYLTCFESIKERITKPNGKKNSYKILSKLYKLPKEQQVFMAQMLTMYGEASGAMPPAEQMAAVLQIIDNRTRYAKEKFPEANQLDVVLQNTQFSMYNPSDSNWRRALFASKEKLKLAIHVIVNRDQYKMKNGSKGNFVENVYHFVTAGLCVNKNLPYWALACRKTKPVNVNDIVLSSKNGHVFLADVPWTFNPNNRYKTYSEKHEREI